MDNLTYTEECRRTEDRDWRQVTERMSDPKSIRLFHTVMGLSTEAGEALDILKKNLFYGREFDEVHFIKELGDVLWYLTMATDILGYSLDEVMDINIEKLKKRFPHKFTEQEANNRKEGDI